MLGFVHSNYVRIQTGLMEWRYSRLQNQRMGEKKKEIVEDKTRRTNRDKSKKYYPTKSKIKSEAKAKKKWSEDWREKIWSKSCRSSFNIGLFRENIICGQMKTIEIFSPNCLCYFNFASLTFLCRPIIWTLLIVSTIEAFFLHYLVVLNGCDQFYQASAMST